MMTMSFIWCIALIPSNLIDGIHLIVSNSVTSFFSLLSRYTCSLLRIIWQNIIARIVKLCQRNQRSISFMYEVFGRSFEIASNRVAITRRDVPAPMNRSLKSATSINNVEYPNNHRINVGIKMFRSWFVKFRIM